MGGAASLSFTPGFNPVFNTAQRLNRFNGFPRRENKPLKRFSAVPDAVTGLKPGVNETLSPANFTVSIRAGREKID